MSKATLLDASILDEIIERLEVRAAKLLALIAKLEGDEKGVKQTMDECKR